MATSRIESFDLLLGTFSKMLTLPEVHRAKRELRGHVTKESLQKTHDGRQLVELLQATGLVGEKKLAFLRKILCDSGLPELVDLLDEYVARKTNTKRTEYVADKKTLNPRVQKRIDGLEQVMGRQHVAVTHKKEVLKSENEDLCQQGMAKDALVNKIKFEEMALVEIETRRTSKNNDIEKLRDSYDEMLKEISKSDRERSRLVEEIAGKEAKIKASRGDAKSGMGSRKSIFELIIDDPSIEKLTLSIERLNKEVSSMGRERDKMEYKLERSSRRLERQKDALRAINYELLHKTREIISLENNLMNYEEDFNARFRRIDAIELEIVELEGAIEENEIEKRRSLEHGVQNDSVHRYAAYLNVMSKFKAAEFQIPKYQDIEELESYSFGESGSRSSPLQLRTPTAINISSSGNLVIMDKGNSRLMFTDIVGTLIGAPLDLGSFIPVDMTVSPAGQIILISKTLVQVLDEHGNYRFQFLPYIEKHEVLPELVSVTANHEEEIFLCDGANMEIQCFCENGRFIKFIRLDNAFARPEQIGIAGRTQIAISDVLDNNVRIIDTSQERCMKSRLIGGHGVCPGEFMQPKCTALDADNNLLVADSGNHRIQVLNVHREVIGTFGRLGSRQGCLDRPSGVAVHPYGCVVVADSNNDRIVVFS